MGRNTGQVLGARKLEINKVQVMVFHDLLDLKVKSTKHQVTSGSGWTTTSKTGRAPS